ncbi:MAG: hypothetical protein AAB383_01395 [Patescibacteria group bacterium]
MKKFLLLAALLTFAGCDDSLHVDMQAELRDRPTVTLNTADGTGIPGFEGPFCTDVVCFEKPDPDYSALTYTPYTNGDELTLTVEWDTDSINTISAKMINKNGEITHRELPYTQVDEKTFLFEEIFPSDENAFALYINVDFVVEGKAQYFFPLQLQ